MHNFVSRSPDISIPEENLVSFVLGQCDQSYDQNKPLLNTLRETSHNFGTGLQRKLGLQKGDVVALFSANSIDYPVLVFGTFYAGGTVTLVNAAYNKDEVASQLKNSAASILVTTADLLDTAKEACKMVDMDIGHLVVIGPALQHANDVLEFRELINVGKALGKLEWSPSSVEPESTAFLCYSSGTTGLPKGVQLSHRNIVANLLQWDQRETRLDRTCSVISVLPFSHIYALSVLIMNPIRREMTSYVLTRFHPSKFMQLIERERITAAFVVPPIVKVLLDDSAQGYDLSSLKFLCSGAAPLSAQMAQDVCSRYNLPISQGYGLTETSPVLCFSSFAGDGYTGSVGQLLPNIILRIINEDNKSQLVGGVGELQVRGPNVMRGYLNNPEANAEAFTTDGYFRTGDIGYMSTNGEVFIIDRLKELIKYKGFQVPPAELESLLLTHPAIQDCAVIGRNCDIEVTELPTAYCVLRPSVLQNRAQLPIGWSDVDQIQDDPSTHLLAVARDIISFIGKNVSNHKKLRGGVVFTDSIPRVPAGKILRRVLRDRTGVQFLV
ncbi:protein of unknown function [Taphrina deformans PYCC 5710]|uniref:Uncharacterized protein n=1 Tax=Taphrina deformans (strain PYCC 5710 / ATCC 11124 / CBS 356.35 / IMI 108563 / JCM 9778 / NBRC 8474) TaxID=1097556 RepID=R4XK52_TAPDE|nr:protein of unknown function [Taphrina deformans PYCC 5710]|eukprot:CCG84829.1 protein of unknown function [Taphrina deformans PYCC 5710]